MQQKPIPYLSRFVLKTIQWKLCLTKLVGFEETTGPVEGEWLFPLSPAPVRLQLSAVSALGLLRDSDKLETDQQRTPGWPGGWNKVGKEALSVFFSPAEAGAGGI